MQTLLKGKTALITGGTAGIGKAIACLYARHGADVAIFGTNQERAKQALKEMEAAKFNPSQKMLSFLVDVSKTEEVDQTIQELLTSWGKIDVLINNAGIAKDIYNTCRAIIRPMMKAKSGTIVNISSVIGLTGNAGQVNYAASKSGMIGFTKSLAKELASRNVRVNCVAPGYIETQMTEGLSASVKEMLLTKIPLGRIGKPDDIAHAVLFLSCDLSSYITGQVLTVDGGMVL
jgi:3-oxoacyl-[acyl-carrier protein] reductase